MQEALEAGLTELDLYDADLLRRLGLYVAELELWNPSLRLVDARGVEIVTRHILDSLTLVRFLDTVAGTERAGEHRLADLGSGAGLPGIPVALARPAWSVCLVERMERRSGFLRNVAAKLEMSQVEVCTCQTRDMPPRNFDVVTARAYQPVDERFLRETHAILASAGTGLFLKGKAERTRAEIAQVPDRVRSLVRMEQIPIHAGFLPENSRHLLRITPAPPGGREAS